MPQVELNYLAILVAAIASMVIGAAWYSMALFGKPWMAAVGKKEEDLKQGEKTGYVMAAVGALVMAYILAHFVDYTGSATLFDGAKTGFWIWLGFVATTKMVNDKFSGRPPTLTLIDGGYNLVSLLVMGAILATWQ